MNANGKLIVYVIPSGLAYNYWQVSGDTSCFDKDWLEAMRKVLQTFTEQQRKNSEGPYTFQRTTSWATDGVPLSGYGYPVKPVGLICSMFRPSDDATIFPFLIPSNFFAAASVQQLLRNVESINANLKSLKPYENLYSEISNALKQYAYTNMQFMEKYIAYEVNGFGSFNLMDDANIPSLLSLPYLIGNEFAQTGEYMNTRKLVLSA